jgi:hypothetical protein
VICFTMSFYYYLRVLSTDLLGREMCRETHPGPPFREGWKKEEG